MSLLHRAAYRLIQAARREPVHAVLRGMEESQWWPEQRLREDQWTRLQRVLLAASRAPDYGFAWRAAGVDVRSIRGLEDLPRLPLLEKAALRNAPECILNPHWTGPVNVHVTTGSSGVPLRVLRSRAAGAHGRAAQLRGRSWFGIRQGDKEVLYGGLALERLGRTRARVIDRLMNRVRLDPFDLSDPHLDAALERIRTLRPTFLYGYPSALSLLAAHALRRGSGRDLGVKLVQTSSERLYDHRRAVLREAFGCAVADEYGAAETSILAMECPQGGLHQATENVLIEVLDAAGKAAAPGEEGEIVATDLNNEAAPLVRYRIGDRGRLVPGGCACGRGLPRMEILEGSAFGTVELPDGRRRSGVVFYFLSESFLTRPDAGLREIVLVRRGARLECLAVPRPEGNPAHAAELARRLEELLGTPVPVRLVESIDRKGSDKYRILVEES
ncbi:MAG TPA: AMP-binding protein [Candidatus Polarisedimenticolia bacterium]|jgi:phenylacetate-CoA ligase|nr:AMP-binding protein [Candidatus Polarisedimenticolia bacterium]